MLLITAVLYIQISFRLFSIFFDRADISRLIFIERTFSEKILYISLSVDRSLSEIFVTRIVIANSRRSCSDKARKQLRISI